MMVAANKADIAPVEVLSRLTSLEDRQVVPVAAEMELALRRAAKAGLVEYEPGAASFRVPEPGRLTAAQASGLHRVEDYLTAHANTGVQRCIEDAVWKLLNFIVVFPVEDETHWTDKKGNVLPDAFFVPQGATARDLAYRVHTDLGKNFIRAINARTKMVVGQDYAVRNGDVLKIVARA